MFGGRTTRRGRREAATLLVSHLKFASRLGWSRAEILRFLQLNLFERRLLGNKAHDPPACQPQTEMKCAWS